VLDGTAVEVMHHKLTVIRRSTKSSGMRGPAHLVRLTRQRMQARTMSFRLGYFFSTCRERAGHAGSRGLVMIMMTTTTRTMMMMVMMTMETIR
jgi:hypothetical protein